jgi:hypothetical protein
VPAGPTVNEVESNNTIATAQCRIATSGTTVNGNISASVRR